MPTTLRRIIDYTNRTIASPLSRYAALILLVAVIFALYFVINHQVSKPYGTGPSIISGDVAINSTAHSPNTAPSDDSAAMNDVLNITNQATYDPNNGSVKQLGNYTNQIQGFLYDRGDGCSSNVSNVEGVIPEIPLPAYYRQYRIGLISADTSGCSISEKISNSIFDRDIGIIFWMSNDQDLPNVNQTIPVFSVNLNTSIQLKNELRNLYRQFNSGSSVYQALGIDMVPFYPMTPNFWLVSMISVAGVLILSFLVSIILHVRINRERRRRIERARMQRNVDESLGMKKWTLDKEVVEKFPVIIYSKKITPAETETDEKRSSADVTESAMLEGKNEGKEETDGMDDIDEDEEQSRNKLSRKASTRSTRSQRSLRAIDNAAIIYSSPNADTTSSDHISNSETRETCAICLDDFDDGDEIRELPCRHWYHVECIDPWLTMKSSSCPLCKKDCKPEDVEGNTEVSIQVVRERELEASQVVNSQNRTSSSSSTSSRAKSVMHFMNNLFRPSQRSPRQQETADERGGGNSYSEMEAAHTSGNV
ncbi:7434_t:CDS:1 [Acaulospora colombiana]|uniref:7434_t:CDS:1 n=1 Tax=Acaulospora colombiana TaxID=27376 RepID=A0ACA9K302_9GLOM|nr:7434_t:CDS:1 [Acaulospora colombiana]